MEGSWAGHRSHETGGGRGVGLRPARGPSRNKRAPNRVPGWRRGGKRTRRNRERGELPRRDHRLRPRHLQINASIFARFASFLVRKQSARCPGTFRTQARPAPARAPTPRPQWKLTLAVTVPGTWHLHQPEPQPTAAEPTQALPNRRSTFLARREPLLVSPVGVAFFPRVREVPLREIRPRASF